MATIGNVTIRIGAKVNQLQADLNKAERAVSRAAANMQGLGERLSLRLTAPLVAFGAVALKSTGDIQALQKGLIAVMGTSEAAAAEFAKLREVAKLPGLGLEEAARGSVQLQAAGFSADEARRSLLAFGNALATVGKGKTELNFVNLALAQLQNKTSGFGQDLRQLTEQLPQLRGALTNAFGTAESEKIAELGVTGKQVVQVLIQEFEKLPKVTGGLRNSFENFGDSVKLALFQVGTALNEAFGVESLIDTLGNKLQSLADSFAKLSPETRKAIFIIAGIAAVVGPALIVFSQLYLAVQNVRLAMLGLAKVSILTTAISGVITFFKLATTSAAGFSVAMKVLTTTTLAATKAFLLNPIVLGLAAAAAAVYLIYENWELVKDVLRSIGNFFIDSYNKSLPLKAVVESISLIFKVIWETIKFISSAISGVMSRGLSGIVDSFANFKNNVLSGVKSAIINTFDTGAIKNFTKESLNLFSSLSSLKGFENVLGGKKQYSPVGILAPQNPVTQDFTFNATGGKKEIKSFQDQISDLKKSIEALSIAYSIKPSGGILEKLNEQIAKLKEKEGILENSQALIERLSGGSSGTIEILPKVDLSGALNVIKDFAKRSSETIRVETNKGLVEGLTISYQESGFSQFFQSLETDLSNIQRQFDDGVIGGLTKNALEFDLLTGEIKKLQSEGFGKLSPQMIHAKDQLDKFGGFEGFSDMVIGLDKTNKTLSEAGKYVSLLGDSFNTLFNQQIANIDAQQQREIDAINNTTLSAEEKEKRITAVEERAAKERRAILRKQAIAAKLNGIFQATVSMLISVAKAAELGPIFGIPAALVMKALGVANIAAIAAAPLPSLAVGTDYVKSDGMAYLHRGEAVVPADVVGGGFSRSMQLYSVIKGNDIHMINERNQALAQRLR